MGVGDGGTAVELVEGRLSAGAAGQLHQHRWLLKTEYCRSEFRGADHNYANATLRGFDPERRLLWIMAPHVVDRRKASARERGQWADVVRAMEEFS